MFGVVGLIPARHEHILEQEEGKQRRGQAVSKISQAFSRCSAVLDAGRVALGRVGNRISMGR